MSYFSKLVIFQKDRTGDIESDGFKLVSADAAAALTAKAALETAIRAAHNSADAGSRLEIADDYNPLVAPSASPHSIQETKWVYRFSDDVTGRVYTQRVGCADTADAGVFVNDDGREELALTSGTGLAVKNAWDGKVLSPESNPTTLLKVYREKK